MANVSALNEKDLNTIVNSGLFKGFDTKDVATILRKSYVQVSSFTKKDALLKADSKTSPILLILEGEASVTGAGFWKKPSIHDTKTEGDIIGVTDIIIGTHRVGRNVVANKKTRALTIDYKKLSADKADATLIKKFLARVALVGVAELYDLEDRVYCMSQTTTREKLMAFLTNASETAGSATFQVDMGRQDLADYLGVDRSAMCAELSKMQKDKLIKYHKKDFTLLKK